MTPVSRPRSGFRLGPYRIDALAGEGAMGRIYRATDTRLLRPVAIKLLSEEVAGRPEALARLESEAKAASGLNHPNIVTVYDAGEGDLVDPDEPLAARRVSYIAMEFIEGKSLREILSPGPISIRSMLDYGVQATEALMRAHEAGIIHRDLKPENLMVRSDGYLKILDFGLARITLPLPGASTARTLGGGDFLVGTAAYMSPEQARGREVDGRSDIFSLGIVLYESLAGRVPFEGESAVDAIAAILNFEPVPLAETAPHVPRDLARTIERCLAKDPEERFQSMRDLSLELKAIRRDFQSGLVSATQIPARRTGELRPGTAKKRRVRAAVLVGAAAIAAAALLATRSGRGRAAAVRVARVTSSGIASSPAISPDAALLVYLEEGQPRRLMLRRLGAGASGGGSTSLPLSTGTLSPRNPVFSADGGSVLFDAEEPGRERSIYRIPALGGKPQKIAAGYRATPSPDGRSLAYLRDRSGPHPSFDLCVSGAEGDEIRCAPVGPQPDELFSFAWDPASAGIRIARCLDSTLASRLGTFDPGTSRFAYSEARDDLLPLMVNGFAVEPAGHSVLLTGSEVYGRGGELRRKDSDGLHALTSGLADYRGLSLDASGTTAATSDFRENSHIELVLLTGNPAADTAGARPLTSENEGDYRPVWSPGGGEIAFTSTRSGHRSLWVIGAGGENARELTPEKADYGWPAWSPDGKRISYACNRTGNHEIYIQDLSGGAPRRLTFSRVFNGQSWWTPDGSTLYFESADASGNPLLKRVGLGPDAAPRVVANADYEFPTVSPDGKYLAVTSEPAVEGEIPALILRAADAAKVAEFRVSAGGHLLTWTPDSKAVVAIRKDAGGENVFLFPLDGEAPSRLTSFPADWRLAGCALDATGRRLLVVRRRNNSDIVLISPLRKPRPWGPFRR